MKKIKVPSDVVKTTFHYLGAKERFPADIPKIHEVFYTLSKSAEFSQLFENFVFDTSKAYPYCPTISFAFDRLQKSNLLACINPGLDEFEVSEDLAGDESDTEALFDENEQKILKEVAEVFKSQIQA